MDIDTNKIATLAKIYEAYTDHSYKPRWNLRSIASPLSPQDLSLDILAQQGYGERKLRAAAEKFATEAGISPEEAYQQIISKPDLVSDIANKGFFGSIWDYGIKPIWSDKDNLKDALYLVFGDEGEQNGMTDKFAKLLESGTASYGSTLLSDAGLAELSAYKQLSDAEKMQFYMELIKEIQDTPSIDDFLEHHTGRQAVSQVLQRKLEAFKAKQAKEKANIEASGDNLNWNEQQGYGPSPSPEGMPEYAKGAYIDALRKQEGYPDKETQQMIDEVNEKKRLQKLQEYLHNLQLMDAPREVPDKLELPNWYLDI